MSQKPDFSFEDRCGGTVCGIDEVGRGPLAGPVVAAAVVIDRARMPQNIMDQINDSKKLTAAKREYLYAQIHDYADVAIAECGVAEIDSVNILQASLLAMAKAYQALNPQPAFALVDGNKAPKLPCRVTTVIKGDSRSLSIAAASIVAKHHRDLFMKQIANDFPHYGWERNAGYGTAAHLKALEIHGVTIHHRRSFSPVIEILVKEQSTNN